MNTKAVYKGQEEFEKKVFKTTYKYFHEFGQHKSQNQIINDLRTRETVVLLNNKRNSILYLVLLMIFVSFSVLMLIVLPLVDLESVYPAFDFEFTGHHLMLLIMTMICILFGLCGWVIFLFIQSRKRFIILDSQGIYYKKIA